MRLTGIPRASHTPRLARVKQQFSGPMLQDIPAAVRQTLGGLALPIKPGQSVALAVGSRGIVNIDVIAKAAVEHVKALGAKPFIFPAMGSHGGGTAEGQRSVLEHYGVTEATMGCPGARHDGRGPARRGPRAARVARPLRVGGGLDRHHQPRQAAHRLRRRASSRASSR